MNSEIRKNNSYRIIVEEVNSGAGTGKTLQFEFQDREDLFKLVDNLKSGTDLGDSLSPKVAVALRLLGPVMMQNRKHALFVDLMPHFKVFMQNLKSTVKDALKDK